VVGQEVGITRARVHNHPSRSPWKPFSRT
jgi:hypothetical protein